MATVDKDFKVKQGLNVNLGGTFGGTVTVATPTENLHAATKAYVDAATSGLVVSETAPVSPSNGDLWFDTVTSRVYVYYSSVWIALATLADAEVLQEHIHDTAIDGTGFIVSQFYQGGSFNSPLGVGLDAGGPDSTEWTVVFDGGSVVDNFN